MYDSKSLKVERVVPNALAWAESSPRRGESIHPFASRKQKSRRGIHAPGGFWLIFEVIVTTIRVNRALAGRLPPSPRARCHSDKR
jgi:hypothetical protein